MKRLLKGGTVVNVFTGELEKANVLIEGGVIIGVGDYDTADVTEDVCGKYICPGFIDGHIHIESTMLTPAELAKASLLHGTCAVVADPHEIANVCGKAGIEYMLGASHGIPMTVYIMLPSCVPATGFDEAGASLLAEDLEEYYSHPRVLGLAEMMNYPGVLSEDPGVLKKIAAAAAKGKIIDGHAPLLSGKELDKYLASGIGSDHECSSFSEATERIRKGQWIMIREGTAARNLEGLIGLFDEPWARRCLLVSDDKHPADLISEGHIDNSIRRAVALGKSVITGIQMATINAAQYFGLRNTGAIAPGYRADVLVLNDLNTVDVCDVYCLGEKIVEGKKIIGFKKPDLCESILASVTDSFHVNALRAEDFRLVGGRRNCRVIKTVPQQLLTEEWITEVDLDKNGGIDIQRDILKIAVIERHSGSGHKGVGFISGIGLKRGAIASSIAHDSHNIVVIGTNENDMACAVNRIISMKGGCAAAEDGKIIASLPLPVAGLMSECAADIVAAENEKLQKTIYTLGVPDGSSPLMTMAFMSLPVIPHLKMTTRGLIDVNNQKLMNVII